MTARTQLRKVLFIVLLVALGFGQIGRTGWSKELGRDSTIPKVVVVLLDMQTLTTDFKDGGIMKGFVRLQRTLNALPNEPAAVVWDYSFPENDGKMDPPNTKELARLFDTSGSPAVIGHTVNSYSDSPPPDPVIHAEGKNRYQGHACVHRDIKTKSILIPVTVPSFKDGASGFMRLFYGDENPLSVAAAAAVFAHRDHLSQEDGWRKAKAAAKGLTEILPAETRLSFAGVPAIGFQVVPYPIDHVSMHDVLSRDQGALKKLNGAVVVVGNEVSDVVYDEKSGQSIVGCYIIAWATRQLLAYEAHKKPAGSSTLVMGR